MMKKILILSIMITTFLFGNDCIDYDDCLELGEESKVKLVNKKVFKNTGAHFDVKVNGEDYLSESVKMYKFSTYNSIIFNDKLILDIDLKLLNHPKIYSDCNNQLVEAKDRIDLDTFSLRYLLNEKYEIVIGAVSFLDGAYSEFSEYGARNGDGLFNIINGTGQGVFTNIKNDNSRSTIGYFKNEIIKTNDDKRYDNRENMSVLYFTNAIDTGKWNWTLNYIRLFKENKYHENLGTLDVLANGISWDNREDNGIVVYGVIGLSDRSEGANKGSGQSLLLGITKDIDNFIFKKDVFIGAEYYKSTEHFQSLVAGVPDTFYSKGFIGDSQSIHCGIKISPKITIRLRYFQSDYDYGFNPRVREGIRPIDVSQKNVAIKLQILF